MTTSTNSLIVRLSPGKAKTNFVSWKSDEEPGFRLMWSKYLTGLLMLLSAYGVYKLRSDYNSWSIIGPALVVLMYGSLVWIYRTTGAHAKWLGVLMGAFWTMVFTAGSQIFSADWQGFQLGLVGLALLLTFVSNGLTTWWPHARESNNRRATPGEHHNQQERELHAA